MKPGLIDEARDALKGKLRWADEMPEWVSWGMPFLVIEPNEPERLLVEVMVELNLAKSKAEARRAIIAGEVKVAGDQVADANHRAPSGHYIVTRGRRFAGRVISSLSDLPTMRRPSQIRKLDW